MNHSLRSMTGGSIFALCAAVAGMGPVYAQSSDLATVYVEPNSIVVEPAVPHKLAIIISGPDGLVIEEALDAGGTVLQNSSALPDGYYNYEIKIVSMGASQGSAKKATKAALQMESDANGRPVGAAAALEAAISQTKGVSRKNGSTRQSGGFRILDGGILDPSARE